MSRASINALEALAERVEIVNVGSSRWLSAAGSLIAGGAATEGLFASRRLRETIQRWVGETRFDVGIAFCSSMATYLEPLPIAKKFVDLVDVDSEKFLQYAGQASYFKRKLYALEGRRLRALEQRIGSVADRVVLATEPEAEIYRKIAPAADVAVVPNGVDLEYFGLTKTPPEPSTCVFTGALDYRANVEGVTWFADNVWPEVRRSRPDAVFWIVGRRPTASVRALGARPGIEVHGDVPDVRTFLERSAVAVAPLRVARGVQNKVLEAMAFGRPVLASPEAAVGLRVVDGKELMMAHDPGQWGLRLLQLWDDADLAARLRDGARRYVETHHRWERCLAPWSEWLHQLRPSERPAIERKAVRASG